MDSIKGLGEDSYLSVDVLQSCANFVQTSMYNGKENESYVETRARLYQIQKQKTSHFLPPYPKSLKFALLRAHYQCFVWTTMKEIIPTLPATDFGWKISEETNNLTPLWFDGSQLPPSLIRGKKKKNTKSPPGILI